VTASALGGAVLVVSAALLVYVLWRSGRRAGTPETFRFSLPVHAAARVPAALNGFALWVGLMIALTLVNYGFPIAQLAVLKETSVPAARVGVR